MADQRTPPRTAVIPAPTEAEQPPRAGSAGLALAARPRQKVHEPAPKRLAASGDQPGCDDGVTFREQHGIQVRVSRVSVLNAYTSWDDHVFVWQFRLTVTNVGPDKVRVLGRNWSIHPRHSTVQPTGVRQNTLGGRQPFLEPGKDPYEYTSAVSLSTPLGADFHGDVYLQASSGELLTYKDIRFRLPEIAPALRDQAANYRLDECALSKEDRDVIADVVRSVPRRKEYCGSYNLDTSDVRTLRLSSEGRLLLERFVLKERRDVLSLYFFDLLKIVDSSRDNPIRLHCENALLLGPNSESDEYRYVFQHCWAGVPDVMRRPKRSSDDFAVAAARVAQEVAPSVRNLAAEFGVDFTSAKLEVFGKMNADPLESGPQHLSAPEVRYMRAYLAREERTLNRESEGSKKRAWKPWTYEELCAAAFEFSDVSGADDARKVMSFVNAFYRLSKGEAGARIKRNTRLQERATQARAMLRRYSSKTGTVTP